MAISSKAVEGILYELIPSSYAQAKFEANFVQNIRGES